ncbi:MAG: LysR family transcriptional regulator [Rhizomicrobium sp.]
MINPQWLKTFITLAEVGNFTRAGQRLGLTQAAVSQQIRHLEAEFGALFIRRPRQIELTPAGDALLVYGSEVDQASRRLACRLSDKSADHGEVSLITPGSIGLYLYPRLLDWQKSNPELIVRHRFAPDQEVIEAVLGKSYAFGLVTRKPDDERLAARAFCKEPLELVAPAQEKPCTWQDLARLGFIDHPDGQAMAARLFRSRYPGNPGVRSLPCHGFSNQIGLLLEPVALGLGFTVIPRYARQAFGKPDAIRVVECGKPVVDTLWLIHRSEWPLSLRAERTIAYLSRRLKAVTAE